MPLNTLVVGKDGYTRKEIELIEESLWRQFCEKYLIDLKRQSDEKKQEKDDGIDSDNIPFWGLD